MVGFEVRKPDQVVGVVAWSADDVYFIIDNMTGDAKEAIEASSWCELAGVGEVYEHDDFTIEVVDE